MAVLARLFLLAAALGEAEEGARPASIWVVTATHGVSLTVTLQ
jgi:hypothetical protein